MMIVGRLVGDSVVRAVGRPRIILYGAAIFVGIGHAVGPASKPAATVGFAFVGLGVANMAPAALSAGAAAAGSPSLGHRNVGHNGLRGARHRAAGLRRDRDGLEPTARICDLAPRGRGHRRAG
jgi:hypothetical protein